MILYYKDFGGSSGEEDSYNIEEAIIEFPNIINMDFIPIEKDGSEALYVEFNYGIKILKKNEIKL
jgi:hypothetical protein